MYSINLQKGIVTRDEDGIVVSPCQSVDEQNYIDYIAWVDEGNEPTVIEEAIVVVPEMVTPRQIRLALSATGLRAAVEAAVAAGSQDVKDTWEFSTEVHRTNPLINQMAAALGQTDTQVDELFILAASL